MSWLLAVMTLILAPAPPQYNQRDQNAMREAIQRALDPRFGGGETGGGGGGTGSLEVKLSGAVLADEVAVLDFLGADFSLSHSPTGEVNVAVSANLSRVGHTHVKADLPASIAYEDEANTFTVAQVVTTDLTVTRASADPSFTLQRTGAGANGALLGGLDWWGLDSTSVQTTFARIRGFSDVFTNGTERGRIDFLLASAGTFDNTVLQVLPVTLLFQGIAGNSANLQLGQGGAGGQGPFQLVYDPVTPIFYMGFSGTTGATMAFYSGGTGNGAKMGLTPAGDLTAVGIIGAGDSFGIKRRDTGAIVYQLYSQTGVFSLYEVDVTQDIVQVASRYVRVIGDAGVADRGGLLLNNTTTAVRHFKQVATFTGSPGTSSRFRMGWVADSDKETFLNGAAALEVGPSSTVGILTAANPSFALGLGGHLSIATLGVFDSANNAAGSPTADQLLSWDAATSKWHSRTVQLSFNSGVIVAATNGDGTSFTAANDGRVPAGTSVAGPTPTVTPIYGGFIVDMAAVPPAGFVWDVQYDVNSSGTFANAMRVTSQKLVHQIFQTNGTIPNGWTTSTTFRYRVSQTGGTAAVYGTASSPAQSPSTKTEVNAFGLIVAAQISAINLAAINADLGIIQAGRIQSTGNDAGVRVSSGYSLPSTWNTYLDLVGKVLTIKDAQGSPVTRVNVGKVGAGTTDYGLQVFDAAAATVMDFTGAKRILAIPIQNQGDKSGAVTIDLTSGQTQQFRLTGNATSLTLQNPTNGARYRVWIQQDETGSRTIAWPDNVMWTNDVPASLTTTAGVFDVFELEYRSSPTARYLASTYATSVQPPAPTFQNRVDTPLSSSTTTHNVNMPATVNAGELLVIICQAGGTITYTTPTGWTQIGATVNSLFAVFAKVAAGSEGGTTVNVATSVATSLAAATYRFSRWSGSLSDVQLATATGTSTTPDPPSLTPSWGVERDVFICGCGSNSNPAITTSPTNYTWTQCNATSCSVYAGFRAAYVTSENPGTGTLGASVNWIAFTLGIRPPV